MVEMSKPAQRQTVLLEERHKLAVRSFSQADSNKIRKCLDLPVGDDWDRALANIRSDLGLFLKFEAAHKDNPRPKVRRKTCLKVGNDIGNVIDGLHSHAKIWMEDALPEQKTLWAHHRLSHLADELLNLRKAYMAAAKYYGRKTKPVTTSPNGYLANIAAGALRFRFKKFPTHRAHYELADAIARAVKGSPIKGLRHVCQKRLTVLKRLG